MNIFFFWLQVHSHVCLDHGIEEQPSLFIVQKYESQLLSMMTSLWQVEGLFKVFVHPVPVIVEKLESGTPYNVYKL